MLSGVFGSTKGRMTIHSVKCVMCVSIIDNSGKLNCHTSSTSVCDSSFPGVEPAVFNNSAFVRLGTSHRLSTPLQKSKYCVIVNLNELNEVMPEKWNFARKQQTHKN